MKKNQAPTKGKPSKPAQKSRPSRQPESNSFVPQEALSGGDGMFLKIGEDDEVDIRIISKPCVGWVLWDTNEEDEKRPTRYTIDDKPDDSHLPKDEKARKFMALVIINRSEGDKLQVVEITQQGIIKKINALAENPKWGNPFGYDITITKTGQGKKTRYDATPNGKSALPKNVIRDAQEVPVNLENYFEDKNVFEVEEGEDTTELYFK